MGIRDDARKILDLAVPEGKIYRSNQNPPEDGYFRCTNYSQATLMANWKTGGIMTGCNAFVGWYATTLGIKHVHSWFEIRKSLAKIHKRHAWVKSAANVRPKYGDILKHAILHVDVAAGFEAGHLLRVAAGQGDGSKYSTHPRPRAPEEIAKEYDVLRRMKGEKAFDWRKLEGWLDIETFFSTAKDSGPVPEWLVGWWRVERRGQFIFYYFDRHYKVQWTRTAPYCLSQPPLVAADTGDYSPNTFGVTVRWGVQAVVEFRSADRAGNKLMAGAWNGLDPLIAEKMRFIADTP